MKVIASSLRKGNVVELDGRLYAVLKAENFHPGKGTPTTSVDMRRISDGVKVAERWRTTEMVEKATVDEREYDFLYADGEGFHFMEPASYEQITVHPDVVGEDDVFLNDGHEGLPAAPLRASRLPWNCRMRVTVEIVETEPVTKGQTASSILQARDLYQRHPGHGAAAYRAGHADRDQHRGSVLSGTRQGLIRRHDFSAKNRLSGPRKGG